MANITVQKRPGETIDIDLDFRNELLTGETIASASASVVGAGTITVGATPTVASPVVTCVVAAGTDGDTDSFTVLVTTNTGEVLETTIYVEVSIAALAPGRISYSTPDNLAARIGPRIYAQLTAETGTVPDDVVAQGWLDTAANTINLRLEGRPRPYVTPVTAPAVVVQRLAGLEEEIALWRAWVYRGIGDQESAAAAAKVDYDAAMKFLDEVAAGDKDLPGAALQPDPTSTTGSGWKSNTPVYTNENVRIF